MRNLCFDPDPAVRERAYHAELAGWESIRTTVAACLNGVKGTAVTLARRRGRPACSTRRSTTTASTGRRSTPCWVRSASRFPCSAATCGAKPASSATSSSPGGTCSHRSGHSMTIHLAAGPRVHHRDTSASSARELGEYARRSFDEQWIDAEPRDGKRGGAFCMPIVGVDESRDPGELRRQLRPGQHAGPRAGARLSQPLPVGLASATPRRSFDVGRDGQHLLRNAGCRSRPGETPRRRSDWRSWRRSSPARRKSVSTSARDSCSSRPCSSVGRTANSVPKNSAT